jgi:deoxyadenosine/deoxycytidine kinase
LAGVFVAVAGNIGAGKSTLTRLASERFHLEPIYESVGENPYLNDFYRDMAGFAFHSQVFFLAARARQHLAVVNPGVRVIQDRTIYEDAGIFARALHEVGALSDRDHATYESLYAALTPALRPPDLLVYLQASLPTLRRHIEERGRAFEAAIPDDYLLRLDRLYRSWIASYDLSPVVVIDVDRFDPLLRSDDRAAVWDLLERQGLDVPRFA